MARLMLVVLLAWGLAGLAQAAPLTAREARAAAGDALTMLLDVNQEFVDEYFHSGEWEKSVAANERMISLRPDDINPYANAAWLLWSTDQVERAMALYQRMLEQNPDNPEGYYIVGHYYFFTRKDYAAALPYLEASVKHGAKPPQRHLYGHCLVKLGRNADALAFWRQTLAEFPDDGVAKNEIEKLTKGEPAPAVPDEKPVEAPPA